jgi:tRNA A37 threonylcarbamoyladenosine synthetase subunit TsaC/SUA5/YrdC
MDLADRLLEDGLPAGAEVPTAVAENLTTVPVDPDAGVFFDAENPDASAEIVANKLRDSNLRLTILVKGITALLMATFGFVVRRNQYK